MTIGPKRRGRAGPGSAGLLAAALRLYLRAAPAAVALRLVATLVSGIAPVAIAWCTKILVDGLAARSAEGAGWAVVGIAGSGIAWNVAGHAARYAEEEISRRVTMRTQVDLFAAVSRPPGLAELEDPAFHDRLQLARQASGIAPAQLSGSVLSIVQSTVTVVGFTATLARQSLLITGLVLVSMLPALLAQIWLGRRRSRTLVQITPTMRRQVFYADLLLNMRAAKEIRLYGLAAFFGERMHRELRTAQTVERRTHAVTFRVDGVLAVLAGVVSGVALAVFAARIAAGQGTVGDLTVLIAALAALQGTLAGVVAEIATAGEMLALFRHYVAVTAPRPAPQAPPVPLGPGPLARGIEFRDVWFRYGPGHDWVLRGVSLTIPAGTSLALVGANGAGKSTLVKLLCGFYTPTSGTILWDGTDITTVDPAELRARIGAVFQDYMAYELSARDNVAVGDLTALDDAPRLQEAAAQAGVHSTLARLPQGYATLLTRSFGDTRPGAADDGEFGVVLSGGQWQRVALARAALRSRAELLVLDEPSSGLDVHAEHDIHRKLVGLRGKRTCLLISHRLNTVRDAEAIAVLADGVVAEHGDHTELMAASGRYAEMFRLQAGGYQVEAAP